MNLPDVFLDRLFRRLRRASTGPLPEGAPLGFATRILAKSWETPTRDVTLWLLPRAIGLAAVFTAAVLMLNVWLSPQADESDLAQWMMTLALEVQP